jgi:protein-S-isoprenylcysteine O-methyltransferase Ste14
MKTKTLNPSWFNLFIPGAIAAHFMFPIGILFHSPLRFLGLILIAVGLALNLAASATLTNSRTPVEFTQTPVQLVATGAFRFIRNPISLGGIIVLLGLAITLGSLVSFFFPLLLFLLMQLVYIPIEEKEMERTFGTEYVHYKRRTRRWL